MKDHLPWPPELPAPPWPPGLLAPAMASVICSALEVPVLWSCPCLSWGASRAPTPPPRWNCYGVGHAFREGGVMSGFCCVSCAVPPLPIRRVRRLRRAPTPGGGHHPSCSKKTKKKLMRDSRTRTSCLWLNADDHNWRTTMPVKRHQQSGAEKKKNENEALTSFSGRLHSSRGGARGGRGHH